MLCRNSRCRPGWQVTGKTYCQPRVAEAEGYFLYRSFGIGAQPAPLSKPLLCRCAAFSRCCSNAGSQLAERTVCSHRFDTVCGLTEKCPVTALFSRPLTQDDARTQCQGLDSCLLFNEVLDFIASKQVGFQAFLVSSKWDSSDRSIYSWTEGRLDTA